MIYIITSGNYSDFTVVGIIIAETDDQAKEKIRKTSLDHLINVRDGYIRHELEEVSEEYKEIWLG